MGLRNTVPRNHGGGLLDGVLPADHLEEWLGVQRKRRALPDRGAVRLRGDRHVHRRVGRRPLPCAVSHHRDQCNSRYHRPVTDGTRTLASGAILGSFLRSRGRQRRGSSNNGVPGE